MSPVIRPHVCPGLGCTHPKHYTPPRAPAPSPTVRPSPADDRLATALARASHAERQLDVMRAGLQRLANGSNDVLARAARKMLRQLHEVA